MAKSTGWHSRRDILDSDDNELRQAARTLLEQAVADIWCEVLGLADVGVEDSFFELGGQSLLATQLVSRITAGSRWIFPARVVLPADSGRFCCGDRLVPTGHTVGAHSPCIARAAVAAVFPQERLWYFQRLVPGETAYNFPSAPRMRGATRSRSVDPSVSTEVVRRHECWHEVCRPARSSAVGDCRPPHGGDSGCRFTALEALRLFGVGGHVRRPGRSASAGADGRQSTL